MLLIMPQPTTAVRTFRIPSIQANAPFMIWFFHLATHYHAATRLSIFILAMAYLV